MTIYLDCTHARSVIRKRLDSAGRPHFKTQCLECGHYGRNGAMSLSRDYLKARGFDPERVPPFDEAAFERACHAERDATMAAIIADRDARRAERAPYYESAEWGAKRAIVMKRAAGVCEGCGERAATQVHHLSYDHFGDEFLWELVAICNDCHERVHADHHAEEEEERQRLSRLIYGEGQ